MGRSLGHNHASELKSLLSTEVSSHESERGPLSIDNLPYPTVFIMAEGVDREGGESVFWILIGLPFNLLSAEIKDQSRKIKDQAPLVDFSRSLGPSHCMSRNRDSTDEFGGLEIKDQSGRER